MSTKSQIGLNSFTSCQPPAVSYVPLFSHSSTTEVWFLSSVVLHLRHTHHSFSSTSSSTGVYPMYCKKTYSVLLLPVWIFRWKKQQHSCYPVHSSLLTVAGVNQQKITLHSIAPTKLVTNKDKLKFTPTSRSEDTLSRDFVFAFKYSSFSRPAIHLTISSKHTV